VKGASKPAVTIVEFSDFECPYCRAVQQTLKQVLETYAGDVRLVFKHLPLEGHRNSLPAARAAYCAGEQDRFWEFHEALFGATELSPSVFTQIANELGLGMPKFQACLNSEQSRAVVVKDLETARLFGVESTPSFIVNGKLIKGALSFADFQKLIEQELKSTSTN
jgi:protein-disulfide isomerase